MAKIFKQEHKEGDFKYFHDQYQYYCLGCKEIHAFAVITDGGKHEFNMDLEKPTVSPSLLQAFDPKRVCHSFIKEGQIQYLPDCFHELRNKTIELPEYPIEEQ